ncbi:serine/threonine-protein phosphatase 6 regulatory ankyrin repeat subunit B-like [Mytilus californianus]|uniref:serine/threonine-protein phosphatase 6 regulatory ankyrin repeat subunit B-like n=1 Tax=Mytilus californianus TaxID=6549 RepID=UPI0022472683|nr:serine/threonine-protein phosphatase 6 regulatory ankyrin repeat subunit B-like [Mytilus californianus]
MPKLSNEEANYLKLIIFINTIATPSVRVKFNQHFPPTSLPTTLKNEESKLRSMRVLNAMQLSLLYPATGATLSENFDISLMVCLLRNLTHIVSPSNGFDKLPANNEIHDGADLARIKHYRNYIFHRSTIPTQQFNDIWTDLTAAVVRLDPKSNKHCDTLESQILTNECLCYGQMEYFPLMCQQYTTRPITDPLNFFNNPYEIFEQEIIAMKEEDKLKYCALLICVLLNASIRNPDKNCERYIRLDAMENDTNAHETEIYGTQTKFSRFQLQNIFDLCELNRETPTKLIFRQYDCLLNTYMKKTDIYYTCIHDKVFECLCYYFGKTLQRDVILYSDSKVIRDHTHITSLNEEHDTFSILVKTKNENQYFFRIIKDILQGNIYDVFCNNQMQFTSYRSKLIKFLLTLSDSMLNRLLTTKDETRENGTDPVTSLYIVCYKGYLDLAEFILDHTNNYFDRRFHPLNAAASSGHCYLLELMISRGAKVNHRDKSGHTPMTMACINKYEAAVKLLIDKGADLNKRTNKGPTPLMWVCTSSNKQLAELLLYHGADIDKGDYEGQTPVMRSRKRSAHEMFDFLIYKGANLNTGDKNAWTSLMWACFYGQTVIVDILIQNRADINQVNDVGLTSYMIACKGGKVDIVKLLIKKGVDLNTRDTFGRTALMLACTEGHTDIVNVLIENRVDIDCQDIYGVTPLIELCSQGHLPLVCIVLEGQANCNKADNEGWTPLMASCLSDNYNLTKLLVEHGADVNKRNKDGETALLVVCIGVINRKNAGYIDTRVYSKVYENVNKRDPKINQVRRTIIKFLLSKGAIIDQQDNCGWSALMWACKNNYIEIASLLIEKGANMYHISYDGKSILQKALKKEEKAIIVLLFRNGISELKELMHAIKDNDKKTVDFLIDDKKQSFLEMDGKTEKSKTLINGCDPFGYTPLIISCRARNIEITQYLINKGADVNMSSYGGLTALREACLNKETELVSLLIEAGANVYRDLVLAFNMKETTIINLLLRTMPNINEILYKSCKLHETDFAYFLIENGADIDYRVVDRRNTHWLAECIDPSTALLSACRCNKICITRVLLELGANVNILSENKTTPLMWASYRSYTDIVRLLVRRGANVNDIDENGWNSLRWALKGRNMKNVDYLIRIGAYIETIFLSAMRDNDTWIIDTLVKNGGNLDRLLTISCEYGDESTVEKLLSNGADIHHQDKNMWTPLMRACKFDNKPIISLLLKRGSFVNNDLLTAVKIGENTLTKSLIEAGGDLNKIFIESCDKKDGNTQQLLIQHGVNMYEALHFACCSNNLNAICKILKFDFDIDECNENGFTPLMTACKHSTDEIFQFLVKNGRASIFQSLKCAHEKVGNSFCKSLMGKCGNEELVETLFEASKIGHYDIIQLLIEKNVTLNQTNEWQDTPLILACKIDYQCLAELLINNGADTGEAFIWAFKHNDVESTRLLIVCGADVHKVDPIEWSPLTWACFIRQENITKILDGN